MDTATNMLSKFVNEISSNEVEKVSNIQKYGLERILKNEVCYLDSQLYEEIEIAIIDQKVKNYVFHSLIQKVFERFAEKGIDIVGIKGIFLAADLYDDIDIRKFNDIDLFIHKSDIKQALSILGELGWELNVTNELLHSNSFTDYEINNSLLRVCHLEEFTYLYTFPGVFRTAYMDLHLRIYNNFYPHIDYYEFDCMDSIISRSTKMDIWGTEVNVLELHDRLLHMLCSFTKETIDTDFKRVLVSGKEEGIRINLLYDIYLLISKYCNEISWDIILERTRELNKEVELLFSLKIIEYIFPNVIPTNLSKQAYEVFNTHYTEELTDGYKRRMIPYALTIDTKAFLTNPINKTFGNLLSMLKWVGPVVQVMRKESFNSTGYRFTLMEGKDNVYNAFNTNFKFVSNITKYDQEEVSFDLYRADNALVLCVHDKSNSNNTSFPKSRKIWVTIGGRKEGTPYNKYILKRICIEIEKKGELPVIDCYAGLPTVMISNDKKAEKVSGISCLHAKMDTSGYVLEVKIPLSSVGIDDFDSTELWFDFEAELLNHALICFANPKRHMFDDPTLLCKLLTD